MGFLRRLFGAKKNHNPPSESNKDKRRSWSFTKNNTRNKSNSLSTINNNNNLFQPSTSSITFSDNLDANKHAIAVAAATAAVAEAALAAAHAAAEVVRLTNNGAGASGSSGRPASSGQVRRRLVAEYAAAVKIQSAFRGYLARRALRALKALVKLQALVRGHIVRKQTADMLRRMQTLVRLQSRARANRSQVPDNMHSFKSSLSHYHVPNDYDQPLHFFGAKFDGSSILKRCSSNANFRNIDSERARFGTNWLDSWMEENGCSQTGDASLKNSRLDDEKSDKILEVDTWKPRLNSKHSTSSSFQTSQNYLPYGYNNENLLSFESPSKHSYKASNQSHSSREVYSLGLSKYQKGREEAGVSRTAENSPQTLSASSRLGNGSRRGPFTPTKSECSFSFFNGYAGYPSYMANTESSKAKVRSLSAPRQRFDFDRNGSTRRSIQGSWDDGINSDRDSDFKSNKAYHVTSNRIGSTNLR